MKKKKSFDKNREFKQRLWSFHGFIKCSSIKCVFNQKSLFKETSIIRRKKENLFTRKRNSMTYPITTDNQACKGPTDGHKRQTFVQKGCDAQWFQMSKTCQKISSPKVISRVFLCNFLQIHITSVSGCPYFTFKVCQTIAGTGMVR